MRVLRSLSVLGLLAPGLLAVPVLTPSAAAAPRPVAPVVQELRVAGVVAPPAPMTAQSTSPESTTASTGTGAASRLLQGGRPRTVLLTEQMDTRDFSVVGVTWTDDPAVDDVAAWVRTRTDGVWSGWQELGGTGDEQPDAGTVDERGARRSGTSPLWVDGADGVQARVDVIGGAAPRDLRVSLVDPGESPADATAGAAPVVPMSTASAASRAPVIRNRAAWGADESIRKGSPSYASSIHAVTLHHTASSNDYSAADVPRLLRGFYAYHVKSNGWSDLGYNFVVDKFGRIWEGRSGGIAKPVIGSHAGGFNTGTVGVSVIGTYDTVAISAEAREAVAQLAAWRLSAVGKDPTGTVRVRSAGSTRYPSGTVVTLPRVYGHRDVSKTSCPGAKGMAALPGIRTRAASLAAGAAPAPAPVLPAEPTSPPAPTAPDAPAPAPAPAPVQTPVAASPEGLRVVAPATAKAGSTVDITVQGGAGGAPVEVWFARRGDPTSSRRRVAHFAPDGTYRTSYLAGDDYTFFAVSGKSTSPRMTTRIDVLPPLLVPAPPRVTVTAPAVVDVGSPVPVSVTGTPGAAVDLWSRRRGSASWQVVQQGTFDSGGRWSTTYAGTDDHEVWASSEGLSSADASTLTAPVVTGPASAVLGSRVELAGRARPGDQVVVESRRRGTQVFTRTTVTADSSGAFRTSYAADDEYEYRALVDSRPSGLRRTTVSPTVLAGTAARRGAPVTLSGTARPGSQVEVLFRRDTRAGLAPGGHRARQRASYAVGRVVTAGADGRWRTTWTASRTTRWYARSDGNATPLQTTAVG